ncbi:hypothetical protein Sjap_025480 [Stephania japonica]|uniref:Uncharacterized protein n=1 Tax=Stephania japonica TaxID=461633 RepID=A0AAP0E1U2_9MAGN
MGLKKSLEEARENNKDQSLNEPPTNLRQVIERLSSLLLLSHSTKVFHGKWQMIRDKLEKLYTGLTAAENCDFASNSAFNELTKAISVTLKSSTDLADRCVNLSYSGKLLMQSDLDVVSSKFDAHLKSLGKVHNAGILNQAQAIVVLKPGVGSSRDDMKFYIKDLLTRLKIGGSVMKRQALDGLDEVISEDEKYVKIVVETSEILGQLVNFLELGSVEIQEQSAKIMLVIAGFDSYKSALVGAGVIAPLIRVLESGSEMGKEMAAKVLKKLTENSDNSWSVSANGGVTALLKLCANFNGSQELMSASCGALKNLAGVEEIRRFMVEEGAISTFIRVMNSKDEASQINAIEFLQIIASCDEPIRLMIIKERGVHALVQGLDQNSLFSTKARELALRAIENFCFSSSTSLSLLMSYGFLSQLIVLIRSVEVSLQELAVKAAYHLCGTSEDIKKALGDTGFMPELVRLFDARSFEVREMAAEALCKMVWVSKNRKRFIQDNFNTNRILQLLSSDEAKTCNRKFLLSILLSLTNSQSGRKAIASSRNLKNLERLAETGIADARSIMKKLSRNRLQSLLSGILNI